ncbi:MAG: hypothetical protein LCH26_08470 [Proteobacteria bacterium]|nr:hypothetical protein [Pseudomonadota bacterium]
MPLFQLKGKPQLYSFKLEIEFAAIEKRVYDNKRYSQRDLKREEESLKTMARDFLEIIETKEIQSVHIAHLKDCICDGAGGVWESATSNLELLAYYSPEAREVIISLIKSPKAKIVWRGLLMLSGAFSDGEILELVAYALHHRSKEVRCRIAGYMTRNCFAHLSSDFQTLIAQRMALEESIDVRESLVYALENLPHDKVTHQ